MNDFCVATPHAIYEEKSRVICIRMFQSFKSPQCTVITYLLLWLVSWGSFNLISSDFGKPSCASAFMQNFSNIKTFIAVTTIYSFNFLLTFWVRFYFDVIKCTSIEDVRVKWNKMIFFKNAHIVWRNEHLFYRLIMWCGRLFVVHSYVLKDWSTSHIINTVKMGFWCMNKSSSVLSSQQIFLKRLVFKCIL